MAKKSGTGSYEESATCLRRLLLDDLYRPQWALEVKKTPADDISQAAIAKVIMKRAVLPPGADEELYARQLKDKISRALNGKNLTQETIELFVGAFGFSQQHRHELLSKFLGIPESELNADQFPQYNLGAEGLPYRTTWVHETHHVGPNGRVVERETIQRLRATASMSSLLLRIVDTESPNFTQGVKGGEITEVTTDHRGLCLARLALKPPLQEGDSVEIAYRLDTSSGPGLQQCRRLAFGRETAITLAVAFDPEYTPGSMSFGLWKDTSQETPITCHENVLPNVSQGKISKNFEEVCDRVVGFVWGDQ